MNTTSEKTPTRIELPGTPRPWMNRAMTTMLHTPGIRRLLGKSFAIMSVTGARTGRRYSTPVQYFRLDDEYIVLSQRMRMWWRNLRSRPEVELLIRGQTVHAHATILDDDEAVVAIRQCLEHKPRAAKYYGIGVGDTGTVEQAGVEALAAGVVVIAME